MSVITIEWWTDAHAAACADACRELALADIASAGLAVGIGSPEARLRDQPRSISGIEFNCAAIDVEASVAPCYGWTQHVDMPAGPRRCDICHTEFVEDVSDSRMALGQSGADGNPFTPVPSGSRTRVAGREPHWSRSLDRPLRGGTGRVHACGMAGDHLEAQPRELSGSREIGFAQTPDDDGL